ncbi:hypothetical protein [Escherichia sp. E4694]|uniref:hypothetical protein n=1 Tax=Escherichia sp. E4694 TaxID=2044464 RepID=UPI001F0D48F6|nr:hypothetical protein [Escherichia sp. E4694]
MSDYLKWYLCHRWLIKFAVKDWMTADANKLKQRLLLRQNEGKLLLNSHSHIY